MIKLTKKQNEIYNFVVARCLEHGQSPTIAEIAEHFDYKSANAANTHVEAIIKKGRFTREAGLSRSLRPVAYVQSRCEVCDGPYDQIREDHVTCCFKCSHIRSNGIYRSGSMFDPEMAQVRIGNKFLKMGVPQ